MKAALILLLGLPMILAAKETRGGQINTNEAIKAALAQKPLAVISAELFGPFASGMTARFDVKKMEILHAPRGFSFPGNAVVAMSTNRAMFRKLPTVRVICFLVPADKRNSPPMQYWDVAPEESPMILANAANLKFLEQQLKQRR